MSPSTSPTKRLCRYVRRRVPSDRTVDAAGGAHRIIEDLRRAEDALRRSEAHLADAQRLSHTGSFSWNVSSGEIVWSEETFRIFGYEPLTEVTMDMVLARVPDDLALVRRAIRRAATHKEAFDLEHQLKMPDGSIKHLHVVAHALVDEPHNLQFAGAVMDVTAHKETEQTLRASEARLAEAERELRLTLDSIPTITWRGASNGYVQYLNKR
jgi:PAS domain S-box-containing protein